MNQFIVIIINRMQELRERIQKLNNESTQVVKLGDEDRIKQQIRFCEDMLEINHGLHSYYFQNFHNKKR